MPDTELLIAFVLAASVFAYMPGPSMLYAAAQTLARGQKAGWHAALGIHLGGYAHVIAAAAGLSMLFAAVPTLYVVLKILGAGYLVWLGVQMFMERRASPDLVDTPPPSSPRQALWQSVTVEVLNPKTAIFYIAFLPQFTEASAVLPVWAQLFVLGTIVNIMFSSADILCVMLASKVVQRLGQASSTTRIARYLGGTVLVGLGVNLGLTRI